MTRAQDILLTDLYQLTMLQGYYQQGMDDIAAFEFFVRKLPPGRNFFVAAGLAQVLEYLQGLHFEPQELDWLRQSGRFDEDFIDHLSQWRFLGDVEAMAEGTLFFPDEPILRVVAPIDQAQLVESRVINILHFQSLIASKAVRCVLAAPDKLLVDFGMRRAHGGEAALWAARACYLAGFAGSSTVQAGVLYGVPVFGTMAHSFVQAHEVEQQAFAHFALAQRDNAVLLIDTYDTERGAQRVVELAAELKQQGITIKAVRLDSGDLAEHARRVRRILDSGGLSEVKIFSSGNLDEYALHDLLAQGAPIDGFGIGTRLDTSADAPYLDCAYKIQEYAGTPRRKRSEGKATWPGRKQVYRRFDNGVMGGDLITTLSATDSGEALLQPAMRAGQIVTPQPNLEQSRQRLYTQLDSLPPALRGLKAVAYPVEVSESLHLLARQLDSEVH